MLIRTHCCLATLSLVVLAHSAATFADDAATPLPATAGKPNVSATAGGPASATPAKPPQKAAAKAASSPNPGVGKTPAQDKEGVTPPEYSRPTRWGLTAGGSQRKRQRVGGR